MSSEESSRPSARTRYPSRWRRRLLVALAVAAAAVAIYWINWPTFSWHQKLTVEIEVDGRLLYGSGVTRVSVRYKPKLFPDAGAVTRRLRGEAVDIGLPDGRHLFVLLTSPTISLESVAGRLFSDLPHKPNAGPWGSLSFALSRTREERVLSRELYPSFVTFDDIADPKTVRPVDPQDLAATFGPGVALKNVTLGITDEPLTSGHIGNVLMWLGDYPEPSLALVGDALNPPLARTLHHGDFRRK